MVTGEGEPWCSEVYFLSVSKCPIELFYYCCFEHTMLYILIIFNWRIITLKCWPRSTEWSRAKANRVCQENTLIIANILFQQHKTRLYTWTSPDGQHWTQTDYILCSQRWRSSIQSAKTKPGADCGSDHELLIAKFRLKLKKVGKTTRPFRYYLNQIPNYHILEVTNRFKGPDLIGRVPDELWMEVHDIV